MKKHIAPICTGIRRIFVILFVCVSLPYFATAGTLNVPGSTLNAWRAQGGFNQTFSIGSKHADIVHLKYFLSGFYSENVPVETFHEATTSTSTDGDIVIIDATTTIEYVATSSVSLDFSNRFDSATKAALTRFQRDSDIPQTGQFDIATRAAVNMVFQEELCPLPSRILPDLTLFPVTKELALPSDYVPATLTLVPNTVRKNGIMCLTEEASKAVTDMFTDAKTEGIHLLLTSAFRRPEIQQSLISTYQKIDGDRADNLIAPAGSSEHQLGTAIDLSAKSIDFRSVDPKLERTAEFRWLEKHAHEYGFVLSYSKDGFDKTGYEYEPWHWRYVGVDVATRFDSVLEDDDEVTISEFLSTPEELEE